MFGWKLIRSRDLKTLEESNNHLRELQNSAWRANGELHKRLFDTLGKNKNKHESISGIHRRKRQLGQEVVRLNDILSIRRKTIAKILELADQGVIAPRSRKYLYKIAKAIREGYDTV
jgi:hypothetical protein